MTEAADGRVLLFEGSVGLGEAPLDQIRHADLVGYTFEPGGPPGSSNMVHVVKNRYGPEGGNLYPDEWERLVQRTTEEGG